MAGVTNGHDRPWTRALLVGAARPWSRGLCNDSASEQMPRQQEPTASNPAQPQPFTVCPANRAARKVTASALHGTIASVWLRPG